MFFAFLFLFLVGAFPHAGHVDSVIAALAACLFAIRPVNLVAVAGFLDAGTLGYTVATLIGIRRLEIVVHGRAAGEDAKGGGKKQGECKSGLGHDGVNLRGNKTVEKVESPLILHSPNAKQDLDDAIVFEIFTSANMMSCTG
ncbi:MAG TPA: hypothetical protein PLI90_04920 [Rhodocyclaceae bacterium]|nr:hypothetical protein [Rhodocyclaceae bacterium]